MYMKRSLRRKIDPLPFFHSPPKKRSLLNFKTMVNKKRKKRKGKSNYINLTSSSNRVALTSTSAANSSTNSCRITMLVSKWPKLTSLTSSSGGPDPAMITESLRTLLASLPAPLPIAALQLGIIVVGINRGGGGVPAETVVVVVVVGILTFWRRTSGGPIGVTACGGVAEGGLLFFDRRRGDAEKFLDCCCFFEGVGDGERRRWFNLPTNAADEEASLC